MIYKLESFVERIKSSVVAVFGDKEVEYADGGILSEQNFDKYWLVDSISVRDGMIVLVMKENEMINAECGEKSFSEPIIIRRCKFNEFNTEEINPF